MIDNFQNLKNFWKNIIKTQQKKCSFKDSDFSVSNWEEKNDQIKSYKELDELGRKLRREVVSKVILGASKELMINEERELSKHTVEILNDYQKEINLLKNQDDISKSTIDTYENSIKEFQNKIKAIIGDDLTNWETKITNDKNITDLQNQVSNLTTKKDNLQKQLKDKQQQIVDHRCDTPNNAELNQTKGELDKANIAFFKINVSIKPLSYSYVNSHNQNNS